MNQDLRSLTSRYVAGDRAGVWDELHSIQDINTLDPRRRRDVEDVVGETIDRAAQNVRTLHHRLVKQRFVFSNRRWGQPTNPDSTEIRNILAEVFGSTPPVLAAWLKQVTSVSFRGHPRGRDLTGWKYATLDPFEFLLSRNTLKMALDEWQIEDDRFCLGFAGDTWHKNDVSGGEETCILLPAKTVDVLVFESPEQNPDGRKGVWFVDYLRSYFVCAGFRKTSLSARDAENFIPIPINELLPV